jgi:uncharacterized protein YcgI (DUF1989 family)
MKPAALTPPPVDADARRGRKPVICYPADTLPGPDLATYGAARETLKPIRTVVVPPRDGVASEVPAGNFFRIVSVEGPQVGDLNLWAADDLSERFYSGKTRALHGTHLGTGDQLWSAFPHLRPMATITRDTLDWCGYDADGGGVHDVIGTRCDPYTNRLLSGGATTTAATPTSPARWRAHTGLFLLEPEPHVHDVLNVFMCTGFTRDTHQYFMKASPVRPGDFLEFFAEIDLLGALSTCPGGDCGAEHSSDAAACYPLEVAVYRPYPQTLADGSSPQRSAYSRGHGG